MGTTLDPMDLILGSFSMRITVRQSLMVFGIHCAMAALLLSTHAHADDAPYRSERFVVEATPTLTVRTSGGGIEVVGADQDEVRVDMFVSKNGRRLSPNDTDLSQFEIRIEQNGAEIVVEAKRAPSIRRWFRSGSNESVSFRVITPHATEVDGASAGGSVSASGLRSTVRLRTAGGSVRVSDIHGDVSASTSGGSITASDLHGTAELKTAGGSIRLAQNTAKLTASTAGGNVRAEVPMGAQAMRLGTSGGNIHIQLPEAGQFDLDLRGTAVRTMPMQAFSGEVSGNYVKGRLGDGGSLISARTNGGRVVLEH